MPEYAHIPVRPETKALFVSLLVYGESMDSGLARILRAFKEKKA